jgi:hypothetical protein
VTKNTQQAEKDQFGHTYALFNVKHEPPPSKLPALFHLTAACGRTAAAATQKGVLQQSPHTLRGD